MRDKLTTLKTSQCHGDSCCASYKALGLIDAAGEGWNSECGCRKLKMECTLECGREEGHHCANMNLGKEEYKELGKGL